MRREDSYEINGVGEGKREKAYDLQLVKEIIVEEDKEIKDMNKEIKDMKERQEENTNEVKENRKV